MDDALDPQEARCERMSVTFLNEATGPANIVDAGQRDINIGMNGVSLKVDSEGFWVASEVPLQVVSSSVGGRPRRDQPYPQRGSAG